MPRSTEPRTRSPAAAACTSGGRTTTASERGTPFFEDGAEPAQFEGHAAFGDELQDGPIVLVFAGRNVDDAVLDRARTAPGSFPD